MCVVAGVCMHARIGPTACVFSMMSSVVIVAIAGFRTQPPSLNMCALKAGFLRSFAAINLKRIAAKYIPTCARLRGGSAGGHTRHDTRSATTPRADLGSRRL